MLGRPRRPRRPRRLSRGRAARARPRPARAARRGLPGALRPVPDPGAGDRNHLPPPPIVLLVGLLAPALVNGAAPGAVRLARTARFSRRLDGYPGPLPPRLKRGAPSRLGGPQILLDAPGSLACCYGFIRPQVAATGRLLARLDDQELLAARAHERHHPQRRDPARYVAIRALASAAFMFPVAGRGAPAGRRARLAGGAS